MMRGDNISRRALLLGALLTAACGGKPPPDGAPAIPGRIVSQTILSDEVLWDLGPEIRGRVVGVSTLADDPRYAAHPGRWPTAIPRVRTTGEEILSLQPDLTILASFTSAETRALIGASGIHTLTLEGFEGFESFRTHVREIGRAVGATAEARKIVESFDARLARLQSTTRPRPTIVSYNGGMAPAAGTTFHDEAEAAGFTNAPSAHGLTGHSQVSLEQVAAWNPDFVVVPCGEDCDAAIASVTTLPALGATKAVQQGHVIGMPSPLLFSTGAGMLDVVDRLARAREAG